MLEVMDLRARYGAVQAVRAATFNVASGEVLAVLGSNGAGKSTLANAVTGLHRARSGRILVAGRDLSQLRVTGMVRAGVALVPQGRRVFGSCTVAEHVKLARASGGEVLLGLDELLELFPKLRERWTVRARQLSGGEQQMLAITRAVLLAPQVIVLDEPTEGLAPSIVSTVGELVRLLRDRGVAVLLMEQDGPFPETVADRVVTMDRGVISTPLHSLTADEGERP